MKNQHLSRRRRGWLCAAVPLLALCLPAQADDKKVPPPKPKPAPSLDVKAFGKLPVRFNGRVTTYDRVARQGLLRISGRPYYYDDQGQKQPAIRWLLETVSGHPRSETQRIIPVEHAGLRKLLELEDRTEPKPNAFRYSMQELRPILTGEKFKTRVELARKQRDLPADSPGAAVMDLDRRHGMYQVLIFSHLLDSGPGRETVLKMPGVLQEVEARPVPRTIPGGTSGRPWTTLIRRSLEAMRALDARQPVEDPMFLAMVSILDAYRQDDAEAFEATLSHYQRLVKRFKARQSPLQYKAPAGWIEIGIPVRDKRRLYGDTLAYGHEATRMELQKGDSHAFILINHFSEKTHPVDEIVNYWRRDQGLVPLPPAELAKRLKSKTVSGVEAPYADVVSPTWHPGGRDRSLSAIVERDGHTWVVSLNGPPELVDEQAAAFERFLDSIKLGSGDRLARWFEMGKEQQRPREQYRQLAAMLVEGERLWLLQMFGSPADVEKHKSEFEEFVRSVRLDLKKDVSLGNNLALSWTLPTTWRAERPDQEQGMLVFSDGGAKPEVGIYVEVLGEATEESVLPVVNALRREMRIPRISEKDFPGLIRHVDAGGRKVALVDLTGPPPQLVFTVPKGWRREASRFFEYAAFDAGDPENPTKISITPLQGQTGNVTANVNRWRQQVGLGPLSEEQIREAIVPRKIAGKDGTYVDLIGPESTLPRKRILGVIVDHGDTAWFFKIIGPAKSVEKEKKAFEAFLDSVKFTTKPQSKPQ